MDGRGDDELAEVLYCFVYFNGDLYIGLYDAEYSLYGTNNSALQHLQLQPIVN